MFAIEIAKQMDIYTKLWVMQILIRTSHQFAYISEPHW